MLPLQYIFGTEREGTQWMPILCRKVFKAFRFDKDHEESRETWELGIGEIFQEILGK